MSERIPLTPRGKEELAEELKKLKTVDRPQCVRDIEEARAHGDLSENAEYHAAKERQGHVEARIRLLEDWLGRCEVIDPATLDGSRVVFGVTVRVFDLQNEEEKSYQIVGEYEADITRGRVSVTSPIAKALIGKQVGEEVTFRAPGGTKEFEIIEILVEF